MAARPIVASDTLVTSPETSLHPADPLVVISDDFPGLSSHADCKVWRKIETALRNLKSAGRSEISILDAGCGTGTWLVRTARRACELGFTTVRARGFDMSEDMIRTARRHMGACECEFDVGDLAAPFPEATGSVDLTLSLSGALNHLSGKTHARVARELARVTSGHLLLSARTVGSLPTIFVDRIENAQDFIQDHKSERFDVDLADGRHLSFTTHLFSAAELLELFEPLDAALSLVGLDVFHSRFSTNPRWNPTTLPYADLFEHELSKLEDRCCCDPAFIDRAAHILLHADYTV